MLGHTPKASTLYRALESSRTRALGPAFLVAMPRIPKVRPCSPHEWHLQALPDLLLPDRTQLHHACSKVREPDMAPVRWLDGTHGVHCSLSCI